MKENMVVCFFLISATVVVVYNLVKMSVVFDATPSKCGENFRQFSTGKKQLDNKRYDDDI